MLFNSRLHGRFGTGRMENDVREKAQVEICSLFFHIII